MRFQRVAEIPLIAILGRVLVELAPAQIFRAGAEAIRILIKQVCVFLLRNGLREDAAVRRAQQAGEQILAERGRLVAQVERTGVAQLLITVREKQMRGEIFVIRAHGARGLAHGHVIQPRFGIDPRQVGAAHGAILVQQQARAIDAAVVVQFLGFFQIAHGVVDAVVLFVEQGGIEPRGRIIGVELLGELQLMKGVRRIAGVGKRLAEVAAERGARRLHRGGDEQILAAGRTVAAAEPAQSAPQPGVAERGINCQCAVELRDGLGRPVLRGQQKTL